MKERIYTRNSAGILEPKEFAADAQLSLLRIADPVATSVIQGFTNDTLIGDQIFTPVKMAKETGRFPAFGKEAFVVKGDIKRAVGGKVAKLQVQTGYVTQSLSEYALGVKIENREFNEWAGTPDQLLNSRLTQLADNLSLYREYLQATAATTYSNYASTHRASGAAFAWASTGNAVKNMRDMLLTVRKYNGRRANVAWFSPAAWQLFIHNQSVLDLMKYQGTPANPAMVTAQAVANLLEVDKVLIGYAVYGNPSDEGSDGGVKKSALTMGYLWDSVQSSNAGVAIVGTGGGIEPAFGYTWERQNSPVMESYYDNATKSQVWDAEHFFDPAVTLNTAGAIIYSVA